MGRLRFSHLRGGWAKLTYLHINITNTVQSPTHLMTHIQGQKIILFGSFFMTPGLRCSIYGNARQFAKSRVFLTKFSSLRKF
jgi:hypothetical protein